MENAFTHIFLTFFSDLQNNFWPTMLPKRNLFLHWSATGRPLLTPFTKFIPKQSSQKYVARDLMPTYISFFRWMGPRCKIVIMYSAILECFMRFTAFHCWQLLPFLNQRRPRITWEYDLSHQPGKFQDEGTSVGDLLGISHAISKRGLHRYSIHATQSISLWNF